MGKRQKLTARQIRFDQARVCRRKIRYESEANAYIALANAALGDTMDTTGLEPYWCKCCQGWHLGHDRRPSRTELLVRRYATMNNPDPHSLEWMSEWAWKLWWKSRSDWKPLVNKKP